MVTISLISAGRLIIYRRQRRGRQAMMLEYQQTAIAGVGGKEYEIDVAFNMSNSHNIGRTPLEGRQAQEALFNIPKYGK